jgi:O-antigen ligase
LAILRRACEFQLYALFFALPFEYYFRSREQALFTSLKLQILLFLVTWSCMKSAEALKLGRAIWSRFTRALPVRPAFAITSFVLVQALAAALASEFQGNALKAAVKTSLGALLAVAAADLAVGFQPPNSAGKDPVRNSVIAISLSGGLTAALGLGALAGIGIFQRIAHLFQSAEYLLGNRIRFLSTMEHPNTAGTFLSAALCASLALAVFPSAGKNRHWKVVWLGLAAVQGLALVLTFSRGAMASTIFAILGASWILRGSVGTAKKRTVMAACIVVLLMGMSGLYLARRGADREGTREGRNLALWGLKAADEVKYLLPGHTYRETIAVENTSTSQWRGDACGVGYMWHSLSDDKTTPLVACATFAAAVSPKQQVQMPISLMTPSGAGEYLLIWFVTCRDGEVRELKDSFSPGILCLISPAGSDSQGGMSERARRYLAAIRDERQHLDPTNVPGRSGLWLAALRMFSQSPLLGMGPDNFRLLKSKYMDIPIWDERILANNLYLEMLSGSGILGLASFLWLFWEFARTLAAKVSLARSPSDWSAAYFGVAYLSAFALHGIVDYFLKFTPIFLLFWLLLGMLCASGQGTRDSDANRL